MIVYVYKFQLFLKLVEFLIVHIFKSIEQLIYFFRINLFISLKWMENSFICYWAFLIKILYFVWILLHISITGMELITLLIELMELSLFLRNPCNVN